MVVLYDNFGILNKLVYDEATEEVGPKTHFQSLFQKFQIPEYKN